MVATSVIFRELALAPHDDDGPIKNSKLWTTERVHHADLGRLHLRAVEAILSPTVSSREIMSSVAYGVTSQGLRVTQRDDTRGRIMAQRIEAPYLASFSGRKTRIGMEKEEWRVVVATLGVSKCLAPWGGLERVLLLEFMTDPCPKQDLVGRSAAAVASLAEWASKGLPGSTDSTGSSNPSAITIARQRSNQRADALVEGVATELNRLQCGLGPDTGETPEGSGEGVTQVEDGQKQQQGDATKASAKDGAMSANKEVLIPWRRKVGNKKNGACSLTAEQNGSLDGGEPTETGFKVPVCLQFVEGLCARAVELSRRDALETWRPLEEAVRQLERDNEQLRHLLEPKYRGLGASPPAVPRWSNKKRIGASALVRRQSDDGAGGSSPGISATELLSAMIRLTPLFVVHDSWVVAKVLCTDVTEPDSTEHSNPVVTSDLESPEQGPDSSSSVLSTSLLPGSVGSSQNKSSTGIVAASTSLRVMQTVVRTLGDVVSTLCEAKEEELLKESMPRAQAYVTELEEYRSSIVGGNVLRLVPSPNGVVDGDNIPREVDEDIWRLFGAKETRLYSSPAALGKKPGRIFLTCNTLWFYSKVMGFESRHVLPLAEVKDVMLLGTALDISSSLLITTKDDNDIMLVFPGTRLAVLDPVALLIRQLSIRAAQDVAGRS